MRILSVQTRDSKHAYFLGLKEKIKWLVDVAVKSMQFCCFFSHFQAIGMSVRRPVFFLFFSLQVDVFSVEMVRSTDDVRICFVLLCSIFHLYFIYLFIYILFVRVGKCAYSEFTDPERFTVWQHNQCIYSFFLGRNLVIVSVHVCI